MSKRDYKTNHPKYREKRVKRAFCICNGCKHRFASIMKLPQCQKCGKRDIKVVNE